MKYMSEELREYNDRANKLEGILAADAFFKQGKDAEPLARKAAEGVYKKIGLSDLSSGLARTVSDPRVVGLAIENVTKEYDEIVGKLTIEERVDMYESDFNEYLGDKADEVRADFEEFKDETYREVMKEIAKAKHIIDGEKVEASTPEDVESAKGTMKKYGKIISIINTIEELRRETYSLDIQKEYASESLQKLYEQADGYEQAEAA